MVFGTMLIRYFLQSSGQIFTRPPACVSSVMIRSSRALIDRGTAPTCGFEGIEFSLLIHLGIKISGIKKCKMTASTDHPPSVFVKAKIAKFSFRIINSGSTLCCPSMHTAESVCRKEHRSEHSCCHPRIHVHRRSGRPSRSTRPDKQSGFQCR